MATATEEKRQLAELHRQIWDVACGFWGKMEADDYKDYVLGLLFYRFLSERVEGHVNTMLANDIAAGDVASYAEAWGNSDYEGLEEDLLANLGFIIEPKYLFSHMIQLIEVEKTGFSIEYFQDALKSLDEYAQRGPAKNVLDNIFEVMDLDSSKLGKTYAQKSKLIAQALSSINKIGFGHGDLKIDLMGDAYEYLIGQFAAGAGKKSGSYYTPSQAGVLLARLATVGKTSVEAAYDGCGGSGSLLLHVGKEVEVNHYYYQELTTNTYNLARMNMMLHGVDYDSIHMENDDTLENPAFMDKKMDVIVANPPYSQKWESSATHLTEDRFAEFGVLPPKGYADYAFLMTMLHTLKDDGTMAILLPHGPLFRGSKEKEVRQKLIEKNHVDAIIGLPDNAFYGTGIPTAIFVLKKNRSTKDILFIDASKDFVKDGNKNYIPDAAINKILTAYENFENVDKYAYAASVAEVKSNDYNLNIPRYVDVSEEEALIDLEMIKSSREALLFRAQELDLEIGEMISQLRLTVAEENR